MDQVTNSNFGGNCRDSILSLFCFTMEEEEWQPLIDHYCCAQTNSIFIVILRLTKLILLIFFYQLFNTNVLHVVPCPLPSPCHRIISPCPTMHMPTPCVYAPYIIIRPRRLLPFNYRRPVQPNNTIPSYWTR